jgi:hypothetical protein
MFCTTIIPTIGRPSLARAVESVLAQQCAEPFEVVVVNDAREALPDADWQQAAQVRVITTGGGRERSVARNAGAAVAAGRYLNFLDDDDWLLPGAVSTWAGLAASGAGWLYGAAQLTDATGRVLFQFRHGLAGNCLVPAMTGEWVPLQASAIAAEAFAAVGGFDIQFHVAEDKDLLARVCQRYDVAGSAAPVAGILRGVWASSSDYSAVPSETQHSRENVFALPGTLARMRASACTPYWRGRLARAYAISFVWNLRHRKLGRAVRRAGVAAMCSASAGRDLLRPTYWRAFARGHLTPGFVPPAP